MAPARPYWKGYLKLSLVSCPVALFPAASTAEKTHFHQVSKKTKHRLRQHMVDEATGAPVETDEKGRGYELADGHRAAERDFAVGSGRLEQSATLSKLQKLSGPEFDRAFLRAQIADHTKDVW
jgi:DNA end-binding protein Ku